MKGKRPTLLLASTLTALIASGCEKRTRQLTLVPTDEPRAIGEQVSQRALAARDAALTHVSERFDEEGARPGLDWAEGFVTPEGIVGSGTYQYSAQGWAVTVSYPIARPDQVVHQVVVVDESTGFRWEDRPDAAGRVSEAPGEAIAACGMALAHVRGRHG